MSSLRRFQRNAEKIEQELYQKKQEKKQKPADDESNWLVSYADMMTLLCGFFIMLFSLSSLDHPKYEKMKEAVVEQFAGEYQHPTEDLAKTIQEVVNQAGIGENTKVVADPFGVSVIFESAVFFGTLDAQVRPEGQMAVNKLIESLARYQIENSKEYKVVVEGHTDSRPVLAGVFPSNWELSSARASSVVRMFLSKGFPPSKMAAIGYADTRPELPSRTPAGEWDEAALAKNRRVVIRILRDKVEAIPMPGEPVKDL